MTCGPLSGRVWCALLVCCAAGPGLFCKEKVQSPVVARVGDAVLTLDDIYRVMPPEYSKRITREQNINYVKQWIDTELLYQEALRQKVHKEKALRERLDRMKRDLLCAELISRNTDRAESTAISEEMVKDYYEKHRDDYLRAKNVFKYAQIVTEDYVTAWKVRNNVTPDNFMELAAQHSKVPVPDFRSIPFVTEGDIQPDIAPVLAGLKIGGTTAPIRVPQGFAVIRLIDKQDKGTVCSLDEVREDIVERMSADMQKLRIDNLLSGLRLKTDVAVDLKVLPESDPAAADTSESTNLE